MKAVVGWIDPGTVTGSFTYSLAKLAQFGTATGLLAAVDRQQSGPHVERGRNLLVQDFLATDADYLLQIDSDMTFDYDALNRLVNTAERMDTPVVGGLCFGYTEASGPFPTIGMFVGDEVKWTVQMPATDRAGCVTCDVTGAAMLLTHRSVFDILGDEPFRRIELNGVHVGEDISFCHKLHQVEIPVVVDTTVKTGHVKQFMWDTESYSKYRVDADV